MKASRGKFIKSLSEMLTHTGETSRAAIMRIRVSMSTYLHVEMKYNTIMYSKNIHPKRNNK